MEPAPRVQIASRRGSPIAIFVATRAEAKPLCRALGATRRSSGLSDSIWRITLDTRELLVARTGVGPRNVEASIRHLFNHAPVVAALSVGVAAGLSPQLQTGDLVVGNAVTLRRHGSVTHRSFSSDPRLQEWAIAVIGRSGDRHTVGPIVTVERIVMSAAEKRRLAAESGALAVDMESGAIASVAASKQIPFLAIRAILDPLDEDFGITFDQFLNQQGEPRLALLARYLLAHPLVLPNLINLGLRTRSICTRLGQLLRSLPDLPL